MFQHSKISKNESRKDIGICLGVNDRCNTYLVVTSARIYGSPNEVRMPNVDAYDIDMFKSMDVRYYDYINDGVKAPPAVIIFWARDVTSLLCRLLAEATLQEDLGLTRATWKHMDIRQVALGALAHGQVME